ncbi:MAG: 2-hydroxyacid dehydrogenase, partial [Candidatus Dormibacteria bacterium]
MTGSLSGTVLVTGASVDKRFLDRLRVAGLEVVNPAGSFPPDELSEPALRELLSDCGGYLLGGDEKASRSALAGAHKLKVISFLGVGYGSYVDVAAASELGIPVTNTPGVLTNSVAEFAIGALLAVRRRIVDYIVTPDLEQEKRSDLYGHPIGVVGLGAIGTRICEILTKGFRADVRYFSRTRKPDTETALGITYLPLQKLIDQVESLVLIVTGTSETTSLINRDLIAARQTPLSVINVTRPEVIAPDALLYGLRDGCLESVWF